MKKNMTNNEALKAIAKSLQKIAKEMKKANELEDTYTLTEEGKALVEQHKNECDDLSNIASETYERYSKCKNRKDCNGRSITLNCTICDRYEEQEVSNIPSDDEVIAAAKLIKKHCRHIDNCSCCEFFSTSLAYPHHCKLDDISPDKWEV